MCLVSSSSLVGKDEEFRLQFVLEAKGEKCVCLPACVRVRANVGVADCHMLVMLMIYLSFAGFLMLAVLRFDAVGVIPFFLFFLPC